MSRAPVLFRIPIYLGGHGGVTAAATLCVDFRFVVGFDGKIVIEATDATLTRAGEVGVWKKADSVTHFDDFLCGNLG